MTVFAQHVHQVVGSLALYSARTRPDPAAAGRIGKALIQERAAETRWVIESLRAGGSDAIVDAVIQALEARVEKLERIAVEWGKAS